MTTHSESVTNQSGCDHTKDDSMEYISPKDGFWFYFQDGDDEIAVFGSGWTGKEVVYVNDNPVSESRNYRFNSVHEFTRNGKNYRIEYKVISMARGEVHCSLFINDELLDTQKKAVFVRSGKAAWKAIAMYFVVGMVFGYLGAKLVLYLM
jgi:hypothetical protein